MVTVGDKLARGVVRSTLGLIIVKVDLLLRCVENANAAGGPISCRFACFTYLSRRAGARAPAGRDEKCSLS